MSEQCSSTLSYTKGSTDKPLQTRTIGDAFDDIAQRFADNQALVVPYQKIDYNYRQLQQEVNQVAKAFLALEVKVGDRVGIWAGNRSEWLLCQLATAKIGAILVNINPAYQQDELEYTLRHASVSVLVMAQQFKKSDFVAILQGVIPELTSATKNELALKKLPVLRHVICLSEVCPLPSLTQWSDFYALSKQVSNQRLQQVQSSLNCQDPINIQYTSGTTGAPKGATLSHYNVLNNGHFVTENLGFSDSDKLIIPVPLYHCFGMVMGNIGCISHGAAMIYPSEVFDPSAVLEAAHHYRATALYSVPTMFISMLELANFAQYDLTSLRSGIMAGSICPAQIMKDVNQRMHIEQLQIAYGMTETSPVSAQTSVDDSFDKRVTTVGRTQAHLEHKIIDVGTGKTVPRSHTGELCTRGYSVMLGYWDNPAASALVIEESGWMHTGDLAVMDDQGYLNIVGRIKDMVIRGGENLYPREIEEFLYRHPQISDVQITGVPDAKFGEELVAWIKLTPDATTLNEAEIRTYCQGKISHFKIPRYIKFVQDYPMTVTGKVQKFRMREMAMAELGLKE